MQFSRQVTEAASRVLQERYANGINLSDFQKLRQFRSALCQITGQNPILAYKLDTIRELIKLNGRLNGNRVIPYSTSSDSVKKKAPSQSAVSVQSDDAVKDSTNNIGSTRNKKRQILRKKKSKSNSSKCDDPYFEDYKDSFCRWLRKRGLSEGSCNTYWASFKRTIKEATKQKIILDSFDEDDLKRIETDLFALSQYQEDAFPSRTNCRVALKKFIEYWKDVVKGNSKKEKIAENSEIHVVENNQIDASSSEDDYMYYEEYKDSFRRWLHQRGFSLTNSNLQWSYVKSIIDEAIKHNIIVDSFDSDDLNRIKTDLFALPQYRFEVFPLRFVYLSALKYFINYWNDDSFETISDDKERVNDYARIDNVEPMLYEFNTETRLENTRPLSAEFENGEKNEPSSWHDLYYWVVAELYYHFPECREAIQDNRKRSSLPDYLDTREYYKIKRTYRSSIKYIAENFYLNANHNATAIGIRIAKWLNVCGLNKSSLKIYYVSTGEKHKSGFPNLLGESTGQTNKTGRERSSKVSREQTNEVNSEPTNNTNKFDFTALSKTTRITDAIREHFPNGFRFDDSNLSLLTSAMGERVDSRAIADVKERMFERKDGVYFFSDFVIDRESEDELFEQVNKYAEINSGFEARFLYEKYRDHLNSICIRNDDDFEDWLVKMSPVELKFTSIGKFRIARLKSYRNDEEFTDALLQKIRDIADANYGTIEENDIVRTLDGFSLACLSHIVKWRADDVFVKEINESTCFQTFVGLGISDDFSESIQNALNKIDQFGLEPTLEVLNGFLATELGYNPRDEYGIDSDRAFRKLIEVCYKGDVPRKWKANVFGKDE